MLQVEVDGGRKKKQRIRPLFIDEKEEGGYNTCAVLGRHLRYRTFTVNPHAKPTEGWSPVLAPSDTRAMRHHFSLIDPRRVYGGAVKKFDSINM